MSLLHPVTFEALNPNDIVSLAEIPADNAVTVQRSIAAFGHSVQEELGVEPKVAELAEEESLALMRRAIRHSFSTPGALHTASVNFDPYQTIDNRELTTLEDQAFLVAQPETAEVHVSSLKFMARCLLKQGARSRDAVREKEATDSLEWFEHNDEARPVIAEVLHPGRRGLARAIGRLASRSQLSGHHPARLA